MYKEGRNVGGSKSFYKGKEAGNLTEEQMNSRIDKDNFEISSSILPKYVVSEDGYIKFLEPSKDSVYKADVVDGKFVKAKS